MFDKIRGANNEKIYVLSEENIVLLMKTTGTFIHEVLFNTYM